MGIFNFAHGEFVLLGALTVYIMVQMGLPSWTGMMIAPIVTGAWGASWLERSVVRYLYKSPVSAMLATYAVGLIMREGARLYLGGQFYSVPAPISGSFLLGEVSVSSWRTVLIIISAAVLAGKLFSDREDEMGLDHQRDAGKCIPRARFEHFDVQSLRRNIWLGHRVSGICRSAHCSNIFQLTRTSVFRFLIKSFSRNHDRRHWKL